MVNEVNRSHSAKKADCAWNAAKANLKAKAGGNKVTNAQIMKEMERLAKLNNCDSVDDFNTKFFSKQGIEYKTDEAANKAPVQKKSTSAGDSIANKKILTTKDSTEVKQDNTRVANKTIPSVGITTQHKDSISKVRKDSVQDSVQHKKLPTNKKVSGFQAEAAHINKIPNSKNRIIEYNKKHAKGNYVIVDKKTCQATVYSKEGKPLKSYEVLLGANKGDDLSTAFAKDQNLVRTGRRTVPGEFKLSGRSNRFGGLRFTGENSETMDPDVEIREWMPGYWGKKKMNGRGAQAIHGTADRESRDKLYGDGNLDNNRQSMGCINIPLKNLNEMESKYGIKANSKLYVLPETKGNELVLTKQKDGTVKFITKYKDPKQNAKVKKIQDNIANKNIQKQLAAKRKKAAQAKALAQQKEVHLLQPSTWKNLFS